MLLDVQNLSRRYGDKLALDRVDLHIEEGSVLGLIGRNGAGKTTLIRHVLGLLRAQSGTVRVFGYDPVKEPEKALARIGYVSEERDLPGWMRIEELLRYTRAFYPDWDEELAGRLCEAFSLDPRQRVRTLSRGQHVRTSLVLALAPRPPLLVLDEPSSGLDPVVRRDVLEAVIQNVALDGRTVLFSSHLLDEVERISDHLALIDRGRILFSEPTEDVLHGFVHLTARGEDVAPERLAARLDRVEGLVATVDPSDPGTPAPLRASAPRKETSLLCRIEPGTDLDAIESRLTAGGLDAFELVPASLDDIFLELTGREP